MKIRKTSHLNENLTGTHRFVRRRINPPHPLPLYSTFRGACTLENYLPTHTPVRVFTRGVRTDPVARLPPPLPVHRHPAPRRFPFPGCGGRGGDTTALLLISSRFRAQLLSLPGQPPPVTYPIALSFSDHTQPRPPYVPPTRPGDKQTGTATFRSTVRLSVIPGFFVFYSRETTAGKHPPSP